MKERVALTLMVCVAVFCFGWVAMRAIECDKQNGTMVRTLMGGYKCIKQYEVLE